MRAFYVYVKGIAFILTERRVTRRAMKLKVFVKWDKVNPDVLFELGLIYNALMPRTWYIERKGENFVVLVIEQFVPYEEFAKEFVKWFRKQHTNVRIWFREVDEW